MSAAIEMVKVKLKTPRCGTEPSTWVQNIGDEVNVPASEAERMIRKGHADRVEVKQESKNR